jgi:hypothetical protein
MSVSEGFQIPSRIAICNMLNKMLSYILATCAHASLRVTYLRHILFEFFFGYEQSFLPALRLTYNIFCSICFFFCYEQICPSYHHYMGKKLSISRCNKHFSLLQLLGARSSLMLAASTTHFAVIMSICFQQACTHMHMRLHAYAHSHSSMHACL